MMFADQSSHSIMKVSVMSVLSPSLPKAIARFRLAKAGRSLLQALMLQRSRQRLLELDAHMLADIGLTPGQARDEGRRSAWDAPQIWRQQR